MFQMIKLLRQTPGLAAAWLQSTSWRNSSKSTVLERPGTKWFFFLELYWLLDLAWPFPCSYTSGDWSWITRWLTSKTSKGQWTNLSNTSCPSLV